MVVACTTLERVKRRLGQASPTAVDTQMDALLNVMITAVTDAFERYLELPLTAAAQTEVHSVGSFASSLWLKTYFGKEMTAPTITSLKTRTHWTTAWADVTAADSTLYALSTDRPGLFLYDGFLPEGSDTVQIVLASSGFAADTSTFVSTYPAMADAADSQIVWEYHRRKVPGQSTIAVQGSTATQQEVRLLTSVLERLQVYRRVWI